MATPSQVTAPAGTTEWTVESILRDVAPSVLESVGKYITNRITTADNNAATADLQQGTQGVSEILKGGYDSQLQALLSSTDELGRINFDAYRKVIDNITRGYQQYATDTRDNYGEYARYMTPAFGRYADDLLSAEQDYRGDIHTTADQASDILTEGSENYGQQYAPYVEAGSDALGYMQGVMNQDPRQMTGNQQRMIDDFQRDSVAGLAASGLRGSGRAGVAAVNEGRAKLMADLYDQNQRRSDSAASTLGNQGFQATGNVANNVQGLADSLADMRYKVGNTAAQSRNNIMNVVAQGGYGLSQDFADKALASETGLATNRLDTNNRLGTTMDQYYGNLANLATTKGQAVGNTNLSKSIADATAAGKNTQAAYATANTNNQQKANTLGNITSVISNGIGSVINNSGGQTSKPWLNPDTNRWVI